MLAIVMGKAVPTDQRPQERFTDVISKIGGAVEQKKLFRATI